MLGAKVVQFIKPARRVTFTVIHCSAASRESVDVIEVDKWHKQRGWAGCGYHYFIKSDGTVQQGRDIEKTPAAQSGHNSGSIAICLNGLLETDFTDAQFDSLRWLCSQINTAYNGDMKFYGHRDFTNAKTCPVFDYRGVLHLSSTGVMLGKQAQAKANSAKARILISKQVVMAYQQTKGLTADGIVGPKTWRVLTNG